MTDAYVLIDTSAWIESLRIDGRPKIRGLVEEVLKERKGATTGMIMVEILGGARNKKEYKELNEDLTALHYFPVSDKIWQQASALSFQMRRKGFNIPATDCLISAVAQINDMTLIHYDKHFEQIRKNSSLKTITIR
jgi:hypothetical protein